MIRELIAFIKTAGAGSESDTERNGFLSWHAESHAVAVGFGVGFTAVTFGEFGLVGLILPAISAGLRGESTRQPSKVLMDLKQEPHYAIAALAVGVLVGVVVRLVF